MLRYPQRRWHVVSTPRSSIDDSCAMAGACVQASKGKTCEATHIHSSKPRGQDLFEHRYRRSHHVEPSVVERHRAQRAAGAP